MDIDRHLGHILSEHHGESGSIGEDSGRYLTPYISPTADNTTIFPTVHPNSCISDMVLRLQVSQLQTLRYQTAPLPRHYSTSMM